MASRKPALQKMASLVEAMDKNGNVFKGFHIWSNIAPAARKDPDLLFAKCLVLPGSTLKEFKCRQVEPPDDEEFTVDPKKNAFNYNVNIDIEKVNDIGYLPHTNTPCVLDFLRQRFMRNIIYTTAEPLLVVVNPFRDLGNTSDKIIEQYKNAPDIFSLQPHVFRIARTAVENLNNFSKSQTILVSGESGAGKTEATKQIMRFFATKKSRESDVSIQQAVLAGNPMLEAFGNAKTVRNNNSSRFGRFMQLQVTQKRGIEYGSIRSFLLEKSRIVHQEKEERSYHIFYQFLKGANETQKKKYWLKPVDKYKFINPHCLDAENINDVEEWKQVTEAFKQMHRTDEEVDTILSIISGILLLGNTQIVGGDTSEIDSNSKTDFANACGLLFLDPKSVEEGICLKVSVAGKDTVVSRWSDKDATVLLQSLAKAMYDRLFIWLIERLNKNIEPPNGFKHYMGLLDIFGFEVFETNSLEQLFINITNEKLQNNFIHVVFQKETELYVQEGVPTTSLVWSTNEPLLNVLINNKPSLMSVLEDQCLAPGASDEKFLSSAYAALKGEHFTTGKVQPNVNFIIVHTIGDIQYNSSGFLEKNKDILRSELVQAALKSNNEVIKDMFKDVVVERGKLAKGQLIASQFLRQLGSLMDMINATECYFIRCVKPNEDKKPLKYVNSKVLIQLSALSIIEALDLRNLGFSYRRPFDEFIVQFKFIDLALCKNESLGHSEIVKGIMKKAGIPSSSFHIGKTMVFAKTPVLKQLLKAQREIMSDLEPLVSILEAMILRRDALNSIENVMGSLIRFQANTRRYVVSLS